MKHLLFLLILGMHSFAMGSDLYLYDFDKNDGIKAGKSLIAERVYFKKHKRFKKWFYVLTDEQGKLRPGKDYIVPGTVVRAYMIGKKNSPDRFELKPDGNWKPTTKAEQYVFYNETNPLGARHSFVVPGRSTAVAPRAALRKF